MKTFHIHIQGIVQGVGFRPFIYLLAKKHKLNGWVNNTQDGVHIHITTTKKLADAFLLDIQQNKPQLAIITQATILEVAFFEYQDFTIIKSEDSQKTSLLLTPDVATCADCDSELFNKNNHRYQYSFITCTNCGPRYSIIKELPYDRENTSMDKFDMCDCCQKEYYNPLDRRYYSQTNSCPACRIKLTYYENENIIEDFDNINLIVEKWKDGKIIAIKGIGGYLLTCDATNPTVIKRLRTFKNRPAKPFALMYHDLFELAEDVEMGIGEKLELESPQLPIVLLSVKKDRMTPLALEQIAPNLNLLGVMMPYTPLFKQLLRLFKKPIIATSGNISHSTIIYDDNRALRELTKLCDGVLVNNREIIVPQDDSVVRYSSIKSYRTLYRRSRGFAPSYVCSSLKLPKTSILALGASLKSTFTLLDNKNLHISQYLGDTQNLDSQDNFVKTLHHFFHLFNPNIKIVLTDKHPNFFTGLLGKEIAESKKAELYQIQHHKAHFFACLAENNLLSERQNILGIIWDGTGLGDDGNIWGGEFFLYQQGKVTRVHHIDEFSFILGDKMAKEPRLSALAISSIKDHAFIKNKFSPTEWKIYKKLLANSILKSTSVGRLFDAVASILLGVDKQSYEGEAAMQLENAAYQYFRANNFTIYYTYLKEDSIPEKFTSFILDQIILDINKGFDTNFIAAKFHISLAHYIAIVAKELKIKKVVFSGGVFQNTWLQELIISFMDHSFDLYFHKQLPPNDENISFGQLMYYLYSKD